MIGASLTEAVMPEFSLTQVEPRPYLYVEGRARMDPGAISEAMGEAFDTVMDFQEAHGIAADGPPLSVYYGYSETEIAFRAGVIVSEADLAAATGELLADHTPGGRVLHFTHVGSYATLRDDYGLMMEHVAARGLTLGAPTWEVYVDDPETTPEHRLRTEVYVTLA
jgi:effector-binding domain-containing protein